MVQRFTEGYWPYCLARPSWGAHPLKCHTKLILAFTGLAPAWLISFAGISFGEYWHFFGSWVILQYLVLGVTVWQWLQTLTLVDLLQLIHWCSTILASRVTTLQNTPGPPRYLVFHERLPDLLRAELQEPRRPQVGIRPRTRSDRRSRSHSI